LNHFEDTIGKSIIFHDVGKEDCINDHNYMASASPEDFLFYKIHETSVPPADSST
jgi:hypothetical protein